MVAGQSDHRCLAPSLKCWNTTLEHVSELQTTLSYHHFNYSWRLMSITNVLSIYEHFFTIDTLGFEDGQRTLFGNCHLGAAMGEKASSVGQLEKVRQTRSWVTRGANSHKLDLVKRWLSTFLLETNVSPFTKMNFYSFPRRLKAVWYCLGGRELCQFLWALE